MKSQILTSGDPFFWFVWERKPITWCGVWLLPKIQRICGFSYEDLAKLLQDHFMPKPSAIVQRFKFNTRSQQPGETIAMFLAELRHLSEHCEFGITLDEMLRDRLVCGVRDIRIQR